MIDYYKILELHKEASVSEIKAAFRRLAKIYHPDKNARGKERFSNILKAYETLSNPRLKSIYDAKLNNKQIKNIPIKKNWRFDEKEIKRRQYYNEYIKKYEKIKSQESETNLRQSYNEYKYILFATPLAVALFLLIINITMPNKPSVKTDFKNKSTNENTKVKIDTLKNIKSLQLKTKS